MSTVSVGLCEDIFRQRICGHQHEKSHLSWFIFPQKHTQDGDLGAEGCLGRDPEKDSEGGRKDPGTKWVPTAGYTTGSRPSFALCLGKLGLWPTKGRCFL